VRVEEGDDAEIRELWEIMNVCAAGERGALAQRRGAWWMRHEDRPD